MSITGAIILFAVIWFLVLFVLLPFGAQSQADIGEVTPGTPAGAPTALRPFRRKMMWATVITAVLWAGLVAFLLSGLVTRADIVTWDRLIRG